jgi:hypothetical protein
VFCHDFTAKDYVLGAVDPGRFEHAVDVGAAGCTDGQPAAAGEDILAGFGFVVTGVATVKHAEQAGVPAHSAAAVGGRRGFEPGNGVGQTRCLP